MKKSLFISGCMLLCMHFVYAQSGVITPTQATFSNSGTTANAYAAKGIIVNSAPGTLSAGVVGQNNGTNAFGAGVIGTHAGGGWGVYGTSVSGTGLFGISSLGIAGRFEVTSTSSNNHAVLINTPSIGTGIRLNLTNSGSGATGIDISHAGVGNGILAHAVGGTAIQGITSSISAAGVIGRNATGEAVVGFSSGVLGVGAVVGRSDGEGYGVRGFNTKGGIGVIGQAGISGGTGIAGLFENVNASNTNKALSVKTNGIGSGILIELSNASSGARGIDVSHAGVGPGVFASTQGNAIWGITSSISSAGVIGDNATGEAVVGRSSGGNGVGAVVGRNDDAGYGVRGFNTKGGIGVLGQAGISGGTGIGGRFENVNASNSSNALESRTNGTGAGASIAQTGSSGNGAGLVVSKNTPFQGAYSTNANVDLDVRHPILSTSGMTGLRILNTGANLNAWTFYTNSTGGTLSMYFNGVSKGSFNASTGAYTSTSDARLKNNIQEYSSTLDKLTKVGVKSYKTINSDKTEVGFMAQDVLQYFPEIVYNNVNDGGEPYYSLDYSRIGVLAVKAVQEQQQIIQKQQAEIDALKADMAELKKLLEKK